MTRRCAHIVEEPGEEPGYTRFVDCGAPAVLMFGDTPMCADHAPHCRIRARIRSLEDYAEHLVKEALEHS